MSSYTRSTCCPVVAATVLVKLSLTRLSADGQHSCGYAKDNARARRFYDKNGFTADGTEQVDPDLDGLVEIRMVR